MAIRLEAQRRDVKILCLETVNPPNYQGMKLAWGKDFRVPIDLEVWEADFIQNIEQELLDPC